MDGYDQYYDYYNANSTCPEGYYLLEHDIMVTWTYHVGGIGTYIICIFNIFVIGTFLKTKMVTPATILFMILAVSDTLAAFCQCLPKHYGILLGYFDQPGSEFSRVSYSFCTFFLIVEGPLFYAIHDTSILLTTMMGIIKVLAIRFPLWFKLNVGKKLPLIGTLICVVVSLIIELYPVFSFSFASDEDGFCCNNEAYTKYFYEYSFMGKYVIPLIYLLAFVSMTLSTTYIASKLTCLKIGMEAHVSEENKRRKRISAINVVIITIVFLVTETLDFICVVSPLMTFGFGLKDVFEIEWYRVAFRYQRLILEVGFASNFIVYLITSKEIRENLWQMLTCSMKSLGRRQSSWSRKTGSSFADSSTAPEQKTKI